MKKWLTFTLLLITLTGTFFPCCMVDKCNDEEIATAKKENKQEPEGNCSPFFACATCPGFTQMSKPGGIVQPILEREVSHGAIVVFNLSTYSASFWQPPRLA